MKYSESKWTGRLRYKGWFRRRLQREMSYTPWATDEGFDAPVITVWEDVELNEIEAMVEGMRALNEELTRQVFGRQGPRAPGVEEDLSQDEQDAVEQLARQHRTRERFFEQRQPAPRRPQHPPLTTPPAAHVDHHPHPMVIDTGSDVSCRGSSSSSSSSSRYSDSCSSSSDSSSSDSGSSSSSSD